MAIAIGCFLCLAIEPPNASAQASTDGVELQNKKPSPKPGQQPSSPTTAIASDESPASTPTTATPSATTTPPFVPKASTSEATNKQPSAPAVTASPVRTTKKRLVVSSWAGAYGDAQDKAIIAPVSRNLGIEIERRPHASDNSTIDSVDATELDQSNLIAACATGRVIKMRSLISQSELSRGTNSDASNDFFANTLTDCGIPTFAWSSILIANGNAMKKLARKRYREPKRLTDLLNPKRYPGKRALIRSPKRLLEMLLLASGTDRENIYSLLATRRGQDQAFSTLDTLAPHILWVDGPREALLALDQGNVTMAMSYSGRAFRRLVASRLLSIWDGHIIDYASWAVPTTSKNRKQAKRFILAATKTERLAAQARIWPYGPMRRSALPLAKQHDLLGTELDAFMPTSELRYSQGLLFNAAFWNKHGAALQTRFDNWLAGIPMGIRVPIPEKAPPPPLPPLPRRG